jgi:hypothetical protein
MAWTDPTITVNVTHVKKAHITELRAAIDAHRTAINSVGSSNDVHGCATSTQDGFMSHVDKAAFNSLLLTAGTITSVNAYAPIVSTGGTNPYISITPAASGTAGSMSAVHYAYLQGLIDKTQGVYSLSVTAPIKNTGTVHEPILDIDVATQSVKGALSATDKTKIDNMLSVPIGGIIMFSPPGGDIRTYFDLGTGMGKIGTGFDMSMFVICDGQNTSPDLTDRFVVAAGNKYASGFTGGEEEHVLTVEELAKHKHSKSITYSNEAHQASNPWGSGGSDDIEGTYSFMTEETGDDQPHNNMPPFYALYFIMRRN